MDLAEALGDWPSGNSQAGGQQPNPSWPGQPGQPTWPGGQPAANPTWPGGQPAANPTWPGGQPAANPTWPGGQPAANPTWPGGQPAANPTWPGGQPAANPTWPGGQPSQPTWPSPQPSGPGVPSARQQTLTVPYKHNLPSGVFDKVLICIAGSIKPNADKITVDMNTDRDLAFHFNPRFNESGKKVIVRNSCIDQRWGKEERELNNFPFVQGQPFEMKILCTNTEFKIAVNNTHLLEFKHRITDLSTIKTINIYNDLTLSKVEVQTLP
ncbi:galectin-3b [Betta splendens]|uniref:Galectin n=1 Tax=Betta splendens TaxID=158456 RepID=A0A6P7LM42_BETSP|nr:galectin-3b [Betta splendens]XP_028995861.1 galectin-3b [Betta splendens]